MAGSAKLGQSVPSLWAWDSLSRGTVEDSREDDDLRFNVSLLETNDNPGAGNSGSVDYANLRGGGLTRGGFGCDTGLRHSWHRGEQPLGVLVAGSGQNMLGFPRLNDLALMKNRDAVANPGD